MIRLSRFIFREIDPLAITEHNINLETNVMSENGIQEFISTGETLIDTNSMDNQLKRLVYIIIT